MDDNWLSLFETRISNNFGNVCNLDNALDLIEEFAYGTHTSYTVGKVTRGFGKYKLNDDETTHHIRFEDMDVSGRKTSKIPYDGIPFMVVGKKVMECHQGPNRFCVKKSDSDHQDHSAYKQATHKNRNCGSKKMGCEATIVLREVLTFPDYKLEKDTERSRRKCKDQLKADINSPNYDEIVMKRKIFIDLPTQHTNHIMGEAADLKAPIDPQVVNHITRLVQEGVTNVMEAKRHVRMFVKANYKDNMINTINRRFHPSRSDLRNIIYREKKRNMKGLVDQDFIKEKISKWSEANPEDFWFYRPRNEKENDNLLLVYQTAWQRKLLMKYGQEIVYLDATYKTTQYTVPLFFLCVKTNCGYCVVGVMILQSENSQTLAEGLEILKSNCNNWTPKAFMVDCSEIENNAIMQCFPECKILLCDFHRKQAWIRWINARKNGVSDQQTELLALLNSVAESTTTEEYNLNLANLKETKIWQDNVLLRNYIERQWIGDEKYKKWVRAYRATYTIASNTNNGVEAINKVFKKDYLKPTRATTLTSMLTCLVEEYLPDSQRSYLEANVKMSRGWRESQPQIPEELRNKPPVFLKHMREVFMKTENTDNIKIERIDETHFRVSSMTSSTTQYELHLGDASNMPKCQCRDFAKNHLMCKHFGIVFKRYNISWSDLPENYRNHPMFNMDDDLKIHLATLGKSSQYPKPNTIMERSSDENAMDMIEDDQESEEQPITRNDIRSLLQEMQNITYMVDNRNLKPIKDTLTMAKEELLKLVPHNDGLPTEHDSTELPKRRKYKKKSQIQKGIGDEEKDSEILEIGSVC